MIEKEMDNRGSKSDVYTSVKEQRVDGSWYKRYSLDKRKKYFCV